VVDEKSQFREDNFQKAMGGLAAMDGEDPANPNGGKGKMKGKTKKGAQKGGKSYFYLVWVELVGCSSLNLARSVDASFVLLSLTASVLFSRSSLSQEFRTSTRSSR